MSAMATVHRTLSMRQVTPHEASTATGRRARQLSGPNITPPTMYVVDLGSNRPVVLSVYGVGPRRTVWLSQARTSLCSEGTLRRAERNARPDGSVVFAIAGRSARGGLAWNAPGATVWWSEGDTHFELQSSELTVPELVALSAQAR